MAQESILNLAPDTTSSIFNTYSKYHVFISFRGEDTRTKFTSFLYNALREKGIKAYIDAKNLRKGDKISSALVKAIQESKISLIIFSEKYATSKWCLDELVHILKCMNEKKQIVIPIFYDVDPSYVRNQKGSYKIAFRAHKRKSTTEKLQEWKDALRTAGGLCGWDSRNRDEPKLITRIVNNVLSLLKDIRSCTTEDLVGIEKHVKGIESLLDLGSSDVRMIGLCGLGGMGKSTLARFVFHRLSPQFEGCCFLENISEESEKFGMPYLESKLFSELLEEEDMIDVVNRSVKNKICKQKVFIVLDDVDDMEQLKRLIKDRTWFGPGSRIIIISRYAQVVRDCVDETYEACALNFDEALQLFIKNAFGGRSSLREGDLKLSSSIVNYGRGHPLILKFLGSFLQAGTKDKWRSTLQKLTTFPRQELPYHTIKLCFKGLDDAEKEILLHITLLKGKDKDLIERKLEESGNLFARKGIQALVEKSFISINDDGKVWMHDFVQEVVSRTVIYEYIYASICESIYQSVNVYSSPEIKKYSWSLFVQAMDHFWRTKNKILAFPSYDDMVRTDYEELEPILKMLGKRYHHSPESLSSMNNPHNLVRVDLPGSQLQQFWNAIPVCCDTGLLVYNS